MNYIKILMMVFGAMFFGGFVYIEIMITAGSEVTIPIVEQGLLLLLGLVSGGMAAILHKLDSIEKKVGIDKQLQEFMKQYNQKTKE